MGLSQGSSDSLKIADFGMVSESIRLILIVTMNRESGAVPRELYQLKNRRFWLGFRVLETQNYGEQQGPPGEDYVIQYKGNSNCWCKDNTHCKC